MQAPTTTGAAPAVPLTTADIQQVGVKLLDHVNQALRCRIARMNTLNSRARPHSTDARGECKDDPGCGGEPKPE